MEHQLHFKKTVTRWDEAVPLGNGQMGVLLWGEPQALRLSLDRADIWDYTPYPGIFEPEFSYQHMIELVKEGNQSEISRIFDKPYNYTTPCKLPAGKLVLRLNSRGNVESSLNLEEARAQLLIADGNIKIESFVHAKRKFGVLRINQSPEQFSCEIENPAFGVLSGEKGEAQASVSTDPASLKKLFYPAPQKREQDGVQYFIQTISEEFSYGVFAAEVRQQDSTLLVFCVSASKDGENWIADSIKQLREALTQTYEELLEEHKGWWKNYWQESSLSVPDKHIEKGWYLSNYLLASCSRKGGYPMQLQGLWTADDGQLPPWKGDYHHDLNTQLSYTNYLKANHLEEGECFIDFLWNLRDCGKKFARSYYHTEGLCLPAVMAADGTALGGWGMYSLSPTNQIWLGQSFERYYRYTGDEDFLREKAYPYLSEIAACILGLLEERDGKYYLPISSSPEIHDATIAAYLTPNSNYDLALMRWLFESLARLAKELQNEEESRWESILEKLPPLAVNANNVLMLSPDESLRETHRHFSHLMSIYPLHTLAYEGENRKIINASIASLEALGTGGWTGYTYAWSAQLYAVQENGNGALRQLRTFWDCFCSQNGFHLNGDYKNYGASSMHDRPFTLEGNMCAADALQEMLLQSEHNSLKLFPAVPDDWQEERVSFKHFRSEGGVLVSAVLEKNQLTALSLTGGRKKYVRIKASAPLQAMAEKYGWKSEENYYIVPADFSGSL